MLMFLGLKQTRERNVKSSRTNFSPPPWSKSIVQVLYMKGNVLGTWEYQHSNVKLHLAHKVKMAFAQDYLFYYYL